MKLSKFQRDILKAALGYYDRGFCVVPIPLGSKGIGPKWKQYQEERPSREQVETWFSDGQDHNIRIICGKVSANLAVLDFDSEDHMGDMLDLNTPIVKTSRGYHVWFRTKDPVGYMKLRERELDVQGEGRYILAPPSRHPSGAIYRFINPQIREPMVIDGLEEIGMDVKPKPRVAVSSRRLLIIPETMRPRYAHEPVPRGERNSRAFRVACYFFKHYRKDIAEERIVSWAHEFCEGFPDDSLTEKALESTMGSAYKTVTGGKIC